MRYFFLLLLSQAFAIGAPENHPSATLMVEGQPLFEFRSRVGSMPPVDRVRVISERISRLSKDRLIDLESIAAHDAGEIGWEVLAGENLLLVITPEDAKLAGHSAKLIAQSIAFRLKEILTEDRRAKSPREILIHSLYALGYLLGLVILLWGISALYRRFEKRLLADHSRLRNGLKIKDFEILPAERITYFVLGVLKTTRIAVVLMLFYFFVPLVLSLFPWTAKLSPILLGYILNPLKQVLHGLVAFIPNLFFIALNILVVRFFLKFIRIFFNQIENGTLRFTGFYPDWAHPTYQLVRALAVAFTLVIIFPYIPGSSSPAFQGVSVFIGVLVSLGSTSAVANVVAGIVITYMRSFRPGDRVKIADTVGDIVEKTLLVTRVRTVKNTDITIPNSLVLSSHIINFSSLAASDGLILHTEVTIGYDAPWIKVHELLIQAARKTDGILSTPAPFVLQTALEDSYVRYQINAYTRQANAMAQIYSSLHQNIQDCFNEANVEIMSPSYSAIRDGNTVTTPADKRPADYRAPSFRVGHES